MSKPLTMSEGSLDTIRLLLSREPEHVQKNAKALLAEVYALRAALAAAESKLADANKAAFDMMNRHRDVVLSLEAKLADAEKHADELAAEMEGLLLRYRANAARRAARDGQEGT